MNDADAIAALRADPDLRPLIERHGPLAIEPADDFFARFVVSVLRQQVSMASAAATRERLFEAVDVTPAGVLAADDATLRDAGLSRQKTRYVNNVAEAFRDRGYTVDSFAGVDDDAVIDELTSITGVGDWTARMQLLFSLGRPDVFPVGDLGIRKGMRALYGDIDREAMVDRAEQWAPYRSYASLYLWRIEEDVADSVDEVRER
ncbi:DNA-3-methyladenine glycosylase 2 family protein [Haloplanus rubicundus]|uniref:DNA-3-methyladenine glycosylase 2 family protein n=1 Tax=Haloplanus rubicundus TaxID=1547898 RepID=A0A345EGH1_9EURY|nr:DNA-3-methyladenine glycosylase [Haloplanus rubicundus]AXG07878.1 DNA-3-methyladenine glycosylase 2 family protein [Haloplanus rubicundus]AXG11293.1 DNA-3-methyladenine glycosylase 2 family protein [Haloplanus rubicundus]